ncbi:MAG: hypothetical protein KFH98_14955 [Gemmatimonadetes bacterium]|nr:hypothetical protein [Gemmatimonadota bacterium]
MRNSATVLAAALALLQLLPGALDAQVREDACPAHLQGADFVGPAADLSRLIDLQDTTSNGSFVLRRIGQGRTADACAAPAAVANLARRLATRAPADGVRLLPPELLAVGNSAYPRDWNDGVLWSGRGLNTALTAGALLRWGVVSAALAPIVVWQSNSDFDFHLGADTTRSAYSHPWYGSGIDAPQRFGDASYSRLDPGQSFVRIDVRGFGAGVSNENILWGPARRNPLLLSGTAAGFPHMFFETQRPIDIWVGDLEFQLFWGRLEESDFFDHDPDNDHRMLAGLLVALQPRILDGLTVGGGRLHSVTWWPELSLSDLVRQPYQDVYQNPQGRFGDNQLMGLFFRWKNAAAGFEVYGEWAREDHWGTTWTELLRNLDHSQAWGLGLQKLIRHGDNALRLSAEVTHLADALPSRIAGRGGPITFYTNTSVRQGHTHRGQMLGAPIGTGAEALFAGGDYFWSGGRTSISIERARYGEDAYSVLFAPTFRAGARDAELSVRAGHLAAVGALTLDTELGWSMRYNRDFLGLDTIEPGEPYRRDDNLSVRLGLRWTPGGGR